MIKNIIILNMYKTEDIFDFTTPEDILGNLAARFKKRRLEKGFTRNALQSISGVPAPTIARFETSSRISLESFVRLLMALGHKDELDSLLLDSRYTSMEEMETIKRNKDRKRGKRQC